MPIDKTMSFKVEKDKNVDYYVIEASSYQLNYSPTLAPKIGIFTNLTPTFFWQILNYSVSNRLNDFFRFNNRSFIV